MKVLVVRNDPERGTYIESSVITPRAKFRFKRDVVYMKRKMRLYGLCWIAVPSLVGLTKWKLVIDDIEAEATDAGLMSYSSVTVAGGSVHARHPEEEFAGHGGFPIAVVRSTQHVIAILEERARRAAEAMDET